MSGNYGSTEGGYGSEQAVTVANVVSMTTPLPEPSYLPFVTACAAYGIGRTKAYELANAGLLETFLIGDRRYVFLDSLRTLPARLVERNKDGGK